MADAEVVIAPDVDRTALHRMNRQFQKSFKKVSDDAEKQVEKGVASGIKKGARRGGKFLNSVGGAARSGVDRLGGARGIATGVGGIAIAGLIARIDRAQQGQDIYQGVLGESTAAGSLSGARAANLSPAQLGQFSAQVRNTSGATDQAEIDDLLQDINVKIEEAAAEGGGLMQQFTGIAPGQNRINSVIASLAALDPAQAQQMLDAMSISGTAGRALTGVVDAARSGGGTFQERLTYLNTAQKTEGQTIGDNLVNEAKLAKEYRAKQLAATEAMKSALLSSMSSGGIDAALAGQQVEFDKQVTLIDNFKSAQQDAVIARQQLESGMKALDSTMGNVLGVSKDIYTLMNSIIGNNAEGTAEAIINNWDNSMNRFFGLDTPSTTGGK